jgi:hypothetical protein
MNVQKTQSLPRLSKTRETWRQMRESWIAYDEFMARFSKLKDGTLLYMGEKV